MPMECLELAGTFREMGEQHGEHYRTDIQEFAAIRLALTLAKLREAGVTTTAEHLLHLGKSALVWQANYAPQVHEEFLGIATAAQIAPELLLIANGYTDFREAAHAALSASEGCTAFIARSSITEDRTGWLGQTWDMHQSAQAFVRVFRRTPEHGLKTLTVSTTGCLSLVGLNEAGLAVGTNNLYARDSRPGVMYLAILHQMLAQSSFEAACQAVTGAERASGHNYLCLSAQDESAMIETTAKAWEILGAEAPLYVHANHYHCSRLQEIAGPQPRLTSSLNRDQRLRELLPSPLTWEAMLAGFRDRFPAPNACICLTEGESATCATILCKPALGELWATQGHLNAHNLMRYVL